MRGKGPVLVVLIITAAGAVGCPTCEDGSQPTAQAAQCFCSNGQTVPLSECQVSTPGAGRVAGAWAGVLRGETTTGVCLTVDEGGRNGTVSYPEAGCTGRLTYLGSIDDADAFEETIVSTPDNCGGAFVELRRAGDVRVDWRRFAPGATAPEARLELLAVSFCRNQ